MYYYIFNGQRVVTGAYSNFEQLQPELYEFLGDENSDKVKFYLANAENETPLTMQEVRNCELIEITIDIPAYRTEKIAEIESLCNLKKEELFPSDKRDEVWAGIETGIYTESNLRQFIVSLTTEKNSLISQINAATTKEAIDNVLLSNNFNNITL